MTTVSTIVTADSKKDGGIGHVRLEWPVTIRWNERSRSFGIGGHVGVEYAAADVAPGNGHPVASALRLHQPPALLVAQRLRAERKQKGMAQGEVAKKTGIDRSYISRLENASAEGTPAQLGSIAHAIGVPTARLYDELDERTFSLSTLRDETIELAMK